MSFTGALNTIGDDQEVEDANAALATAEGGYIAPDVETDQAAITEQVFTDLAVRVPGWEAHDGNLEVWLTESWGEVAAELRALIRTVPASIFTTYGVNVLGILPGLASGAAGVATFTASDAAGYTLDVGAVFGLARSGDDIVAFQTVQQGVIAPGDTVVDGVPFVAVEQGAAGNGLGGGGQMLDPIGWVAGVQVDVPTSGGADAEAPEDYLDRLTNLLRMVALRPVLPQDFAILALQVLGVGRAVALNLYNPADGSWANARTVTLILTDDAGLPVAADVKQAVVDDLEALREVNWVVHVIDALYEQIAVDFTVTAFAGQDASTVHDTCVANLTAFLSPARFRLGAMSPAIAGGEVIPPPTPGQPARRQVVRINDLVALLDRSLGVDYVEAVTINGAAADHQLAQPYSLPEPGAITGTVHGAAAP